MSEEQMIAIAGVFRGDRTMFAEKPCAKWPRRMIDLGTKKKPGSCPSVLFGRRLIEVALPVRCDKGHSYIQGDVYPADWSRDAPLCPECLKIWMAENDVDKMPNFPDDERPTWDTAYFEILEDFTGDYEVICVGYPDTPICACYDTSLGTAKEMAERIAILLNQM